MYAVFDLYQAGLAVAQGDAASAVDAAERGLARPPAEQELLPLLLVLAEARNDRGEFAEARAAAERGLALTRKLIGDLPHSVFTGRGLLERGIALVGQGEGDAGRRDLQAALEQLERSVGPDAHPTKRARAKLQATRS
jgi:tetratricopeptide (TPR) repeat protein